MIQNIQPSKTESGADRQSETIEHLQWNWICSLK